MGSRAIGCIFARLKRIEKHLGLIDDAPGAAAAATHRPGRQGEPGPAGCGGAAAERVRASERSERLPDRGSSSDRPQVDGEG